MRTNITPILLALAVGCGGTATGTDPSSPADADRDGYSTVADCDDTDAALHPGATEVCGDTVDQDCSGSDLACPADTTAPILSGGQPTGTLSGGTTQATLRVTTDEAATCKWATVSGTAYAAMASTFTTTGTTSHSTVVTGLTDGQSYTYYVRCQDGAGNATTSDLVVTFDISVVAGPISVSLIASRASGVAPLSVFFDATGTTDTAVTSQPFHDLEYRWNFDDPAGGATWAYGAQAGVSSKNLATGPVAAHVFETPGTYTVALSVFDGTNTATSETTVTVADPDAFFSGSNTICISSNTDPTPGAGGCPTEAAHYQQADFATAINSYIGTGKRLLFKRGDTFTEATAAFITAPGPGTIGAYGTGAKPIIQATGNVPLLRLSTTVNPVASDWRIMDVYFDGLLGSATVGFASDGTITRFTFLRVDQYHAYRGFSMNGVEATGNNQQDEIAIIDCTVDSGLSYDVYMEGHYVAIMGNAFTGGPWGERSGQLVRSIVSHNYISSTGTSTELIKLHSPTGCSTSVGDLNYTVGCSYTNDAKWPIVSALKNDGVKTFGYTEQIIIADNKFVAAAGANYQVTIGTQNGHNDERARDIIFERNWMLTSGQAQSVWFQARNVTARNNICDASAGTSGTCFFVAAWGVEPPPDNVRLYNNTMYNGNAAASQAWFSIVKTDATNVVLQNNLAYAPSAGSVLIYDAGNTPGSGFVQSNNAASNADPDFAATPTVNPADFKITAGSYAIGTGAVVPVWSDFFLVPQTSTRDMGAVIH